MELYKKCWSKNMLKGKLTEISILASPAQADIQAVCHSSCDHNVHVSYKEEKGTH